MNKQKVYADALKEEGLDATVSHDTSPTSRHDTFTVEMMVDGEPRTYRDSIIFDSLTGDDELRKLIVMSAENAAREFRESFTERVEWGEKAVDFDNKGDRSATCLRCGAEVSVDDIVDDAPRVTMAESTVPNPKANDYGSLPSHKVRLLLLAMLRRKCDLFCPNSPRDPLNHRNT